MCVLRPMLTYRTAGSADAGAIVALVEAAYRGEASRSGWTTEADLLAGQRTDLASVESLIQDVGSQIVLGFQNSRLLACAHLQQQADVVQFGMFAVIPELQGQGYGKQLLAEAERQARHALKCRTIRMHVISLRSELLAFYQRRGYRLTCERAPFPYGNPKFGDPLRPDLEFSVLEKALD
jgi:ribosomal protein S18 acetylase RimI-like enzyme